MSSAVDEMKRKPRILAVTNEGASLRDVRIVMPFSVLQEQGYILDYAVTNTDLDNVPDGFVFDVVWLQRVRDLHFIIHLVRFLGEHFVYDLDDLLLALPSFVKHQIVTTAGMEYALAQCGTLAVTSERMIPILERHSGVSLASKAVVCPNGCRLPTAPRPPEKPAGILWSSSDNAALTSSHEAVFGALSSFAGRHDLPLYCFGYMEDSVRARFRRVVDHGFASFWHHKLLLATHPAMIGVAPLETRADLRTLDFINAKSDIKLVDFVGFGHPCVCSHAPPYVDTDLDVGIKVENTGESWTEGLEHAYESGWMQIACEQENVIGLREMRVLAQKAWLQAILKAQLPEPVSVGQFQQSLPISLRRRAFAFLSSACRSSPLLGKLKSRVPNGVRAEMRRLLRGPD